MSSKKSYRHDKSKHYKCVVCLHIKFILARGLCDSCYKRLQRNGGVKKFFTYSEELNYEPTEEELEKCIAEQMQCLPPWWDSEIPDDE